MTGHSAHDDAGYVPPELFEEWAKKDPIIRFEKVLLKDKSITKKEIATMEKDIEETIDDAVDWAMESPYPEPEDTLTDVYYDGDHTSAHGSE